MSTMSTRQTARKIARRNLRLESLERRELLAGNVQASVIGSKLFLTGDNLDNNIAVVALSGGRYAVAGLDTTVNGSDGVFVTPRPVAHLSANLNAGNDGLGLTNNAQALFDLADALFIDLEAQLGVDAATLQLAIDAATSVDDFSLSGSLTVAGGAGDDVVAVIGNIGGSVVVSLGTATTMGGNIFGIDGQSLMGGTGMVGGGISVVGDGQSDNVLVAAMKVRGSVSAALGAGDNNIAISGSMIDGGVSVTGGMDMDRSFLNSSVVGGHVNIAPGQGDNLITVGGIGETTVGSLTVSTGAGRDTAVVSGKVRNGVSIWTGAGADSVTITQDSSGPASIGGSLVIDTGMGNDSVTVQANVRHSLVIGLGDGNDNLEFLGTVVGFNATIDAGSGNDRLLIAQSNIGYFLYVFAGPGDDNVAISTSDARAAYLFGGLGNDDLDVDAATLAAVDFLLRSEFEA